jgi:hypothetical protein
MIKLNASNLQGDIYGGLTAGVVALPLALAMGVASAPSPGSMEQSSSDFLLPCSEAPRRKSPAPRAQ